METFAPTSFHMALSKYVIMNILRIEKNCGHGINKSRKPRKV